MATCYLASDIPVIAPYVERFKVASFERGDAQFLHAHDAFPDKPVIVSLGMSDDLLADCCYLWQEITHVGGILHCISAYPCPVEQANLHAIQQIKRYAVPKAKTGLSDHTKSPITGAVSVGCGAEIIEFHTRLADTDPKNADYEVARTPEEAREYVSNVRLAEKMLGTGERGVQPSEVPMLQYRVRP